MSSHRITLTLQESTLEAVKNLARQESREVAAMARLLIERALAQELRVAVCPECGEDRPCR